METIRLYHGSDRTIRKPDLTHNTGFADLGKGFYLTDDLEAAQKRAASRARREGSEREVVSAYDFNQGAVPWTCVGKKKSEPREVECSRFGLRFATTKEGLAAWVSYIEQCRKGKTEVDGLGTPAVVRAWIATEEVEMACAGYVSAEDVAAAIDPADLVVQYCLLDQELIKEALTYVSGAAGTQTP
ncbi:MAG: DUF3990 domain-containing protein [Atopobiaceae bacterium]|nr:DUF3990 domain-containing protein [Atopobiaceae bacterium]